MESLLQKIKENTVVMLLLLTGAVFLFLKYLSPLLSPFILAMLFLTIFGSTLQKMQKLRLHRQVGAVLLLIFALAVTVGILFLLGRWLWNGLPQLLARAEYWKTKLPGWADDWVDLGIQELKKGAIDIEKGMLGGAIRYTGKAAAVGGGLVTFFIAVILLAKDYDELMNRLLDREDCHLLLSVICGVIRYIATYVKAQFVIMTIIATICSLALTLAGIQQGVFWGMLAGLLDALPFIGTGVVLAPLAMMQVLEGRVGPAIICVSLYVGCIITRELLEPKLIGKRMGVRPVAILISLFVGIKLFGLAGIIKGPLGFVIIRETWQERRAAKEGRVSKSRV